MKYKRTIVWMMAAMIAATARGATAAEPTDLGHNAALKYWQAFAMLPQMSDADNKAVVAPPTAAVDDTQRALADRAEFSLKLMAEGAAIGPCDWGLNDSDGPAMLLPHAGKSRELSRLAALRANVRFADGNADGAIDDLVATFCLGHHMADHGLLIEVLVGYATDAVAVDTGAAHLQVMSTKQHARFAEAIAKLPPLASTAEGMTREKAVFGGWFKRVAKDVAVKDLLDMLGVGDAAQTKGLAKALADPKTLQAAIARFDAAYDTQIEAMRLPYAESIKRLAAIERQFGELSKQVKADPDGHAADAIVVALMPTATRVRTVEAKTVIRRAMLRAAIAYADGGADAAAKVADPVTGKAFEISPVGGQPGWIELKSTVLDNDKPVSLRARIG
ncbi:MAG: hypothetical protein GC159_21965 [Phycisphaera sp.]|nr:hypothetical protein [Phycisphaera sp.]